MINKFDKPTVKQISQEVIEKLSDVAANHGITIQLAGGSYDVTTATIKLKLTVLKTQDGTSAMEGEFRQYAHLFGLRPEHYGMTFRYGPQQQRFQIVGLKVGASKRPIVAKDLNSGKNFVFEVETVAKGIGVDLYGSRPFQPGGLTEVLPPGDKEE